MCFDVVEKAGRLNRIERKGYPKVSTNYSKLFLFSLIVVLVDFVKINEKTIRIGILELGDFEGGKSSARAGEWI
jgi:hypothetical protein